MAAVSGDHDELADGRDVVAGHVHHVGPRLRDVCVRRHRDGQFLRSRSCYVARVVEEEHAVVHV